AHLVPAFLAPRRAAGLGEDGIFGVARPCDQFFPHATLVVPRHAPGQSLRLALAHDPALDEPVDPWAGRFDRVPLVLKADDVRPRLSLDGHLVNGPQGDLRRLSHFHLRWCLDLWREWYIRVRSAAGRGCQQPDRRAGVPSPAGRRYNPLIRSIAHPISRRLPPREPRREDQE